MQKQLSFAELTNIDMNVVNTDGLTDVSGMTFDNSIPQGKRAEQLLKTVGNPYCFRVGDMGVKLEFSEDAPALQDVLTDFLTRKKSGL